MRRKPGDTAARTLKIKQYWKLEEPLEPVQGEGAGERKRAKNQRREAAYRAESARGRASGSGKPKARNRPGAARAASIEPNLREIGERRKFLKSSNSSAKRWNDAGKNTWCTVRFFW